MPIYEYVCLSNDEDKLIWQCSKGHVWKRIAREMIERHPYCPTCIKNAKKNRPDDSNLDKS